MDRRQQILIIIFLVIAVVVSYLAWPSGPELPPGTLGQRLQTLFEQGYAVPETTYHQFSDFVDDSMYDYTEYEEPADWTTFQNRLTTAMDTVPGQVIINYVYDESLVRGEIIYFRVDTPVIHELVTYWIR